MASQDRRAFVIASLTFNGIDFVEVANDAETILNVHFLNSVKLKGNLTVTITGGESIPTVKVMGAGVWLSPDGSHVVYQLSVAAPGDFSNYTLTVTSSLHDSGLDPYFASSVFSFKARCPSELDCQPAPVVCPAPLSNAPPIDYLAKDSLSFRQALLDFSALRYPEWQERSEADFGVMFLEALCSLADDLSYTQDRIAAEATLETATQRRSVVRQARLVDYEPSSARAAAVLLQFDVSAGTTELAPRVVVSAQGPDGTPIPFETGITRPSDDHTTVLMLPSLTDRSVIDPNTGATLSASPSLANAAWNSGIQPYFWHDNSQQCLRAGSTQMYIQGHGFDFYPGQPLLIETVPPADPPIRQIVRLLDASPGVVPFRQLWDPLYSPEDQLPPSVSHSSPHGTPVTQIFWRTEDALTDDRDLTQTTVAGNLIIATQALTQTAETFLISQSPPQQLDVPTAIIRTGPNDNPASPSLQYLYTLRLAPLAWIQPDDPTQLPLPEVVLTRQAAGDNPVVWQFQRLLLDAQPSDTAFTVDAARYTGIGGTIGAALRFDYDGDAGDTLRFGDGVFGARPIGGNTFSILYRVTAAAAGNVAADAISAVESGAPGVISASNPLPATGGADPETVDHVRQMAPQAFRAVQYRAVLPADYEAAAETLTWVQRAGTVFRWTGSWLTVFTTPDPLNSEQIQPDQRTELITLLNRYRMAGYESYVPDPIYVSLDLVVEVCAQPGAFQGDVEQAVLTTLNTSPGGFFAHDNFTFGQALQLSALEAAVQGANGVAGVTCVRYRIRGRTTGFTRMRDTVKVGVDEIIRCDNDPSLPEHGSLKVIIQGGK